MVRKGNSVILLAGFLLGACGLTVAQEADQPYVKPEMVEGAIVKPLTAVPGSVEEGQKVVTTRALGNCIACHQSKALSKESFQGNVAPPLDGAGTRYTPEQLRAIIVNAKEALNPDTAMPAFYIPDPAPRVAEKFKGKTIMTAQQVEDVVAYLTTYKE
jgi:L-cysteine S-thiosulfotransferase